MLLASASSSAQLPPPHSHCKMSISKCSDIVRVKYCRLPYCCCCLGEFWVRLFYLRLSSLFFYHVITRDLISVCNMYFFVFLYFCIFVFWVRLPRLHFLDPFFSVSSHLCLVASLQWYDLNYRWLSGNAQIDLIEFSNIILSNVPCGRTIIITKVALFVPPSSTHIFRSPC